METQETQEDEVIKVSVIQEIRRFQEEINKVEEENGKFYRWKMRRTSTKNPQSRKLTSAISTESLLGSHNKKTKGHKRVSYCDAVTVFGSSESLGWVHFFPFVKAHHSRQISCVFSQRDFKWKKSTILNPQLLV